LATVKNPHDERAVRSRRRILDATVQLVISEGVDAVTIQAAAEAAGVQRSTVYNHWADRLALIVDAIEDFAGDPVEPLVDGPGVDQPEPVPSALDAVRALVTGLGRSLSGAWGSIASSLAAAAEHDEALADAHRAFVQNRRRDVERLLQAAVDQGALHHGLDVRWATSLLVGPVYYERLIMHRPMTDHDLALHIERTLALLDSSGTDRSP
jgi:AcrR family transcriptional regulator